MDESIRQYLEQLSQVEQALAVTKDRGERANLESLKKDLTELLQLTRETLDHETQGAHPTASTPSNDIDEEFALFMAEINAAEAEAPPSASAQQQESPADILKDLVGSKCSAPHVHKWGSTSYHAAMVCSVDTTDEAEILVKVLFINPTHQEMVPCSYFLEGECKFSDEKCRFSHGEVVPFVELKDYQEPRFELLRKKGATVLAKQKNRLWVKGTIKEADFESKTCKIQLTESKREMDLPFEDVLPLGDSSGEISSDSTSSSDSDDDDEDDTAAIRQAEIITRSLLNPVPTQRLGEWERHTKGIGSKIMQKMGYVVGAGLGCRGEGIVVPVSAQVLPQGRSLDYCMELRERANGDKDLFSVEKKILRQKQIQERREAKQLARAKEKKKDVFAFINSNVLGAGEGSSNGSASKATKAKQNQLDLPSCSSKNLNIASLKLAEQTRRLEGDISKLTHSLKRHQPGSQLHKSLQKQIADKRSEIALMQATECSISREQQLRSDKRKITVF